MPPVVIAAVAAAGSAIGGAFGAMLIMGAVQIGTVLAYGMIIGGAYAMQERAKKKARAQYNASQVDRLVNIGTPTSPRELVLGRVRKGGTVVFRASTGKHLSRFVSVIAIAGHEIDAVEAIYLNDTKVVVDPDGYVVTPPYLKEDKTLRTLKIAAGQSSVVLPEAAKPDSISVGYANFTSSPAEAGDIALAFTYNTVTRTVTLTAPAPAESTVSYQRLKWPMTEALTVDEYARENSKARIRWKLGAPGQTADARLMELFPEKWTEHHKLTGIAYLICEFRYDESAFPSGLPTVTAVVRGAKCFDPRSGLTVWTENPALHSRHVVTHPWFGARTSLTATETARVVAAANACDVLHNYVATPPAGADPAAWAADTQTKLAAAGVLGPQKLYRAALVAPYGTTAADLLDDLTQAMAGAWAYASGELFLRAGAYTAPVAHFSQEDLANTFSGDGVGSSSQSVSINVHAARVDKINTLTPRIWDSSQDYKSVPLAPVDSAALVARDGGVLATEQAYAAVFSATQAAHVAGVTIRDLRDPLTVDLTLKLSAYHVELFDVIALTISRYGWDAKEFLVMSRTWSMQGGVTLRLKETSAAIYQPDAVFRVAGYAANTLLPRPWDLEPPENITLTSGTSDLRLSADGRVISTIRVRFDPIDDASLRIGGYVEVRYGMATQIAEGTQGTAAAPEDFSWKTVADSAAATQVQLLDVYDGCTYAVQVRTRSSIAASPWTDVVYHKVLGKDSLPSNVVSASIAATSDGLTLAIVTVPDLDVIGYEVRRTNANWGIDSNFDYQGNTFPATLPVYSTGTLTWYIKALDSTGHYSANAYAVSHTLSAVSNPTGLSSTFTDTSLTAATVTLSWVDAVTQFGVSAYQISYGSTSIEARTNSITLPADWVGNRAFTIKTVDRLGVLSSGVVLTVEKKAPAAPIGFRAQVIDNTVLFYWTNPVKTSLPIAHVKLKKGSSWAGAATLGTKDGEFTTVTELAAGDYTYWCATVDTDNVESTPVSLTTRVSQPPDFVFNGEFNSTFSGTKSNAYADTGVLYLPVNTTETFATHFTANGWTTPDAQIAAGFPYYLQPGTNTGYYEEVFDFGTALASSNVTVNLTGGPLVGTLTTSITTSVSLNGSSYTDYPGLSSVFATNFRYVKVRFAATQTTSGALYALSRVNVRLDAKLKSDAGSVSALSTDVNGTLFNFNTEFVDVIAITPSPNSTANLNAVASFNDTLLSGTYTITSGVATIAATAHSLPVGGKVRLAPSSGSLLLGTYTVASVPNANSFTVATVAANSSGNVSVYANCALIYLYNSSGVRQSGPVSIAIRGV